MLTLSRRLVLGGVLRAGVGMERELVRLVGAGIQVLAEGMAEDDSVRSRLRGYTLVEHLTRAANTDLGPLVVGTTLGIWADWRQTGFSRQVAEETVAGLTPIIDLHRPDSGTTARALEKVVDRFPLTPDTATVVAEVLARNVIERATAADAFERGAVNPRLAFFVLERLFAHLIVELRTLAELHPHILDFLSGGTSVACPEPDVQPYLCRSAPMHAAIGP